MNVFNFKTTLTFTKFLDDFHKKVFNICENNYNNSLYFLQVKYLQLISKCQQFLRTQFL